MARGGDPVGLGLVASLARPGGNVTGPSMMNTEIIGKRMQLLKEVVPGLTRVAVLANSVNPIHALFRRETEPAARELGLEFQLVEARLPEDFEPAFAAATRGKAGALIALDDALTYNFRSRIVALAAASRLPALYGYREFPDEGGLMSSGANMASHYRLAAAYVDKILRGAKPGDLPVEHRNSEFGTFRKFYLVSLTSAFEAKADMTRRPCDDRGLWLGSRWPHEDGISDA